MSGQAGDIVEPDWVAHREAGYEVRSGSGPLLKDPDACFLPPPGFRERVTASARNGDAATVEAILDLDSPRGAA